MELKALTFDFSVCKINAPEDIDFKSDFYFTAKTDEEISLVCKTQDVPADTLKRDDGWKCFRIQGELDFSLVGILSDISAVLAENRIGIFAVSTYNTDYIFVKKENFRKALTALEAEGYIII